ncbi:MAG: GMP synthase, partial [Mesorhizobium sp.]
LIAERHADWNDRLDGEITRNGSDADAAGLAIARAWVATI